MFLTCLEVITEVMFEKQASRTKYHKEQLLDPQTIVPVFFGRKWPLQTHLLQGSFD
jgi:hypothetical protein